MSQWKDAEAFRFGKAGCRKCGHHPIMHLSEQEILTGKPGPCSGAAEGAPPCTCVGYEPSPGDEPSLIPIGPGGEPKPIERLHACFKAMHERVQPGRQGLKGRCPCCEGSIALFRNARPGQALITAHSPPACGVYLEYMRQLDAGEPIDLGGPKRN